MAGAGGRAGKAAGAAAAKRIGDVAFDGAAGRRRARAASCASLADDLKRRIGSGIVAVVSRAEGKAAIVVGVTADLTGRFDAVELVRAGAEALGGKGGGGRADMAQAGGPEAGPRRGGAGGDRAGAAGPGGKGAAKRARRQRARRRCPDLA